jgi:hypothetical protein
MATSGWIHPALWPGRLMVAVCSDGAALASRMDACAGLGGGNQPGEWTGVHFFGISSVRP